MDPGRISDASGIRPGPRPDSGRVALQRLQITRADDRHALCFFRGASVKP